MNSLRPGRRTLPRLPGIALLVTTLALGMLAGCAVPLPWVPANSSSSSSMVSVPAPAPFIWQRVTPAPPTPQQAYVAGMSMLNICGNRPPADTTTTTLTWLVAGPTYGVVLAHAMCMRDGSNTLEHIALLPLALDKTVQPNCPAWVLDSGIFETRLPTGAKLGPNAYQIPSWLPLPADSYEPEPLGGGVVPSALFVLQSSTRLFITGRFEGRATRPDGAETVSIGGRTGWQVSDHDIVTVTVSLADGWTFFFSGTADAATMQRLTSASLGHLDTLLPKPLPTPTDYPQPTPAC